MQFFIADDISHKNLIHDISPMRHLKSSPRSNYCASQDFFFESIRNSILLRENCRQLFILFFFQRKKRSVCFSSSKVCVTTPYQLIGHIERHWIYFDWKLQGFSMHCGPNSMENNIENLVEASIPVGWNNEFTAACSRL